MSEITDQVSELGRKIQKVKDQKMKNEILQEQILGDLKDMGYKSVEDAEKKLKQLDELIVKEEESLEEEYNEFVKKFGDKLDLD